MYAKNEANKTRRSNRIVISIPFVLLIGVSGFLLFKSITSGPSAEELLSLNVVFESSITQQEKDKITSKIIDEDILIEQPLRIGAILKEKIDTGESVTDVLVPVTAFGSIKQDITTAELKDAYVILDEAINDETKDLLVNTYGVEVPQDPSNRNVLEIALEAIAFVPIGDLTHEMSLLSLDGDYYLDTFDSGAFFRQIEFEGAFAAELMSSIDNLDTINKESVFKVNISGVTALTRVMQRKLAEVGDPLYFSAKIGDFLADADLTHVSNEVSFVDDCSYSNVSFCSPPEFIETLKASGVDLVELTGNHNNDRGSQFNTNTIELYNSLGWNTFGGGLNLEEARKPYVSSTKNSTVAFLAYNYPDSPGSGAIAGLSTAGANPFDFSYTSIEQDIKSAKESSDFVIINVQYWECYAYPDGYIEYPICDKPIGEQEAVFKKLVDLGADMVVGSSAHQPQTFELYNGKPIYYGLGNLYFEQTSWPGTERGIILTNYFSDGKLLQTKLTPTVYGKDLQTRKMNSEEASYLLGRLQEARL